MIDLKKYDEYWDGKVTATQGKQLESPLQMAALITTEAKLKDLINKPDTRFPLLVSIIPSATFGGRNIDEVAHTFSGLIFVLEKVSQSNKTPAKVLEILSNLGATMKVVMEEMLLDYKNCNRDGHWLMSNLELSSMNLEPEENYLGCDGYSLAFRYTIDW